MSIMTKKSSTKHIMILYAPYYEDVAAQLLKGATTTLLQAGATFEEFAVPGALEIPQALAAAIESGLFDDEPEAYFHGVIALGCVIRGETSHYDIVAEQSASALMTLSVNEGIPLGNGILTVETKEQAMVRASIDEKNKGHDAANACLRMIELTEEFTSIADDEADENV